MRARPAICVLLLAATLLVAGGVRAVEGVSLAIARLDGAGWAAEDLEITLNLFKGTGATLKAARVTLPASAYELRDVHIVCPQLELSSEAIACANARLEMRESPLGPQAAHGRLVYHRRSGAIDLELAELRVAGGAGRLATALTDEGWRAELVLDRVAVEPLLHLAQAAQLELPASATSGLLSLSLDAHGAATSIAAARFDATFVELSAHNEEGSVATDGLALRLTGTVTRDVDAIQFEAGMHADGGQAYVEPLFLDFGRHAAQLSARGRFAEGVLTLERFALDHRDVSRARGTAVVELAREQPLRALSLDLEALEFPGAYTSYLQPLLIDTDFKALETEGRVAGRVEVHDGAPRSLDLEFHDLTLDDGVGALALAGLAGSWHWRDVAIEEGDVRAARRLLDEALPSHLSWRGGSLFGLSLGASQVKFATIERQFRLLEPARIPLLDGALELESFRVRNAGTPQVAFLVNATVRPISAAALCRAFGWPEFGGSVGGAISRLRMRDGRITLGTTLRAQVFDGEVTISDLRLEQPFSQWPRFHANLGIDNLDLELVTRAFEFGRITGRLSGAIEGLELFNWTPVAFDARLYTPPGDRSRRRISQRAVENIGSIGGGGVSVTAALSNGFLRFFDDFNYRRLGISCRLENDVCHMDGVSPAPNSGYYLVEGSGIPRINVIGNARRVDWPRLVQQLVSVTQSEGPVLR